MINNFNMFNLIWYKNLIRPPLTPPAWVFAPAWAILYTMIFISLIFFAFKPSQKDKKWGYTVFFCQLALNLCWSPVFFYFHNIEMALAILSTLIVFVLFTIIEFFKVSKTSGLLLLPYFLWLLFALYLNFGFLILN